MTVNASMETYLRSGYYKALGKDKLYSKLHTDKGTVKENEILLICHPKPFHTINMSVIVKSFTSN